MSAYPDREALNTACRATREANEEWQHAILVMRDAYFRLRRFWVGRPHGSPLPKPYQQIVAEQDHDAALIDARAAEARYKAAEAAERRVREELFPCAIGRGLALIAAKAGEGVAS